MPGCVYGAALNFTGNLAALGDSVHAEPYRKPPAAPVLYIKPRNTWIGPGDAIPCPQGVNELRVAGTLGVVFGRAACRVSESEALDYIAGYLIANDVSIPHESYFRPAIREKCRDGFCPLGPMLPRDAIADPASVAIRILINDRLRCSASTGHLVRSIPRLISDVSEFLTLRTGDVLLIGEPHDAPLAAPGDRVRVEIDGLGSLENPVV